MTTKIEVPCSGCSTDPCYIWPYCTELLSLRRENERLRAVLERIATDDFEDSHARWAAELDMPSQSEYREQAAFDARQAEKLKVADLQSALEEIRFVMGQRAVWSAESILNNIEEILGRHKAN